MSANVFRRAELLYANSLAAPRDLKGWRMEGEAAVSFPLDRVRLESRLSLDEGQRANIVAWCPEEFPDRVEISWDFWPIREPGLAILFFAARGREGESVIDDKLAPRSGPYDQYHHGDIDAYHVSYFRRNDTEGALQVCNLRKSYGFHLVAQGPDPIPGIGPTNRPPYRVSVTLYDGEITFTVGALQCFFWTDLGEIGGPRLGSGSIGFRQMAPLIAEYANLTVHRIERA